jgi:hypothetical protein
MQHYKILHGSFLQGAEFKSRVRVPLKLVFTFLISVSPPALT